MGNYCVGREEEEISPADSEAAYKHYSNLYHWVHSCLTDPQILKRECSTAFQSAEKDEHGDMESQEVWRLTQAFMAKCECNSPHSVEAIFGAYSFVSKAHPSVNETQFFEYMKIVFGVIERDLRDKVTKFGLRYPNEASRVTHPETPRDSHRDDGQRQQIRNAYASQGPQVRTQPETVQTVPSPSPPKDDRSAPARVPIGAKMEGAQPASRVQTISSPASQPAPAASEPYDPYARLPSRPPPPAGNPPDWMIAQALQGMDARERCQYPIETLKQFGYDASGYPEVVDMSGSQRINDRGQRTPTSQPTTPPMVSADRSLVYGGPGQGGAKQDPDAIPSQNGNDLDEVRAVEDVKQRIRDGLLQVGVYNQKLEVEWKKLKVSYDIDTVTGQMQVSQLSISDEVGGTNAAFQISDLLGISQGITANIMDKPPPADRVVAFQFSDGTLCILFEDPKTCQLALKALKQLCQVPVYA